MGTHREAVQAGAATDAPGGARVESVAVEQFTLQADTFATAEVITDDDALRALAELADVGPGDTVLDAACGPGIVAVHLAEQGATVTGVDLTPRMVELARQRAREFGVAERCSFVNGHMEALPADDHAYCAAVSRYALHHAADPEAVADELCRVVRPDGRIVIVDFSASSDAVAARSYDDAERLRDPSHVRNLTADEQKDLFVRRGWDVAASARYKLTARLEGLLARSHGTDLDGVRRAFRASLDSHRMGVDARLVGDDVVFDYPIAGWAFELRSGRRDRRRR